MTEKNNVSRFDGKKMILSILIAALIALIVSITMGDQIVWAYMIPMGVAIGTAVSNSQEETSA